MTPKFCIYEAFVRLLLITALYASGLFVPERQV
jgi:hypothetical protein